MRETSKSLRYIFALIALSISVYFASHYGFIVPISAPSAVASSKLEINTQHILYGDHSGGGHLYGTGKACKTEFPQEWSADEVIANIKATVANDNATWKPQRDGRYAVESKIDNVRLRVILTPDKSHVITAYPLGLKRNPCPAHANDN